jgi:hypothetical protein
MERRDFFDLKLGEQVKILEHCGTTIALRETEEHIVLLYGLLGLYVEVWYLRKGYLPILCREVSGLSVLELYVQHLNWKDLF